MAAKDKEKKKSKSKYALKKARGNQMYGPGCCAHDRYCAALGHARRIG